MNQINLYKQSQNKGKFLALACLAVFVSPLVLPQPKAAAVAPVITKIFDFTGTSGTKLGADPEAGFIQITDPSNSLLALFGTTTTGGSSNQGIVYKLTSSTTTGDFNNETVLATFSGSNGANSRARVTSASISGTNYLVSTTYAGGTSSLGTFYSLTSPYTTLTNRFSFTGTSGSFPGANPLARPIQDGLTTNLFYGTTYLGGANNLGVIYKYTLGGSYLNRPFTGTSGATVGSKPKTRLTLVTDTTATPNKEYYYGTTSEGGANSKGVVFKLAVGTTDTYTYASFNNTNGSNPDIAALNPDASNTYLYSVTKNGGANGYGAIYRVPLRLNNSTSNPVGSAAVAIELVASFTGPNTASSTGNGAYPLSSLTRTANGDFYGVVSAGGANGYGGIYRLRNGVIKLIYSFTGSTGTATGSTPSATLISVTNRDGSVANSGKYTLYGTTSAGGANGYGTVFKAVIDPNEP